jgi:hypothetical protein
MKATTGRLFNHLDRREIERDIGAELQFHLDLLTQEYLQRSMSLEEARDAALKQFGNVEQIKDRCVEISKRRHPLVMALKCFLAILFVTGAMVRIVGWDFHISRCGDLLMAVSILSWLLLYVRLNPSRFGSQHETSSPLKLTDQTSFAVYDQKKRTPVERLISR